MSEARKIAPADARRFLRSDIDRGLARDTDHPRRRLDDVRDIFNEGDAAQQQNRISLAEGGCLYAPPVEVLKGFIDAALRMDLYPAQIYPQQNALPAFIDRIWGYFKDECGIPLAEGRHGVVFGFGCSHLFDMLLSVVGEPGKIVLMPSSYYHAFAEWPAKWGVEPHLVETQEINGYKMTGADLRQWCAKNPDLVSRVCCVAITNPAITGAAYTRAELEELGRVAETYDFLIFSDEVFHDTGFAGREIISTASVGTLAGRTVTASSGSKARSVAEARIGWACGPEAVVTAMIRSIEHSIIGIPLYLQAIGLAVLNMDRGFIDRVNAECIARVNIIKTLVRHSNLRIAAAFPGRGEDFIRVAVEPEAGHYVCLDFNAFKGWKTPDGAVLDDGRDLFRYFFHHQHVNDGDVVQHGVAFSCGYSRGHNDMTLYVDFAQSGYELSAAQAQAHDHRELATYMLRQVARRPLSDAQLTAMLETLGLLDAPDEIDYAPVHQQGKNHLVDAFDRVVCAIRMLTPP